jgi:hypothetical protein
LCRCSTVVHTQFTRTLCTVLLSKTYRYLLYCWEPVNKCTVVRGRHRRTQLLQTCISHWKKQPGWKTTILQCSTCLDVA